MYTWGEDKLPKFNMVQSRTSVFSVYYDQSCKRMQILLCQDGYLFHEGELVTNNPKLLDEYERHLESYQARLDRDKHEDVLDFIKQALIAVEHVKRSKNSPKKTETLSIELDILEDGSIACDFLDEADESFQKVGPFGHQNGFLRITLSLEHNWKKVGGIIVRQQGAENIKGAFRFTDSASRKNLDNPIRSCRAAGTTEPKKIGSYTHTTNERYTEKSDRRTVIRDLTSKESYASLVKLIMEFEVTHPDTGVVRRRFYQGTGVLMNMKLQDGQLTKPFILTCAHNVVQIDIIEESKYFMVGCTAYIQMKNEKQVGITIPIHKFKVYDEYFALKPKDRGFDGKDFALLSINIDSDMIAKQTYDCTFDTKPVSVRELKKEEGSIEVEVPGYSDDSKTRFVPRTMKGVISRVIPKSGNHALVVYDGLNTGDAVDGGMIHHITSAYDGMCIGIHCGCVDKRSFGAILTQTVMCWIHDTVTTDGFWAGSNIDRAQIPIGSHEAYDPYAKIEDVQYEEEVEAADRVKWEALGYY